MQHRDNRGCVWLHSQILLDRTVTRATNMKKQTVTRQTPGGDLTSLQIYISQGLISQKGLCNKVNATLRDSVVKVDPSASDASRKC